MLYLSYKMHCRPYLERWMLYLETYNEATLLAVLWASLVFVGYQEVSGRVVRYIGWVCTGLTAFNVMVNVTMIVCKVVEGLAEGCGKRKVVQIMGVTEHAVSHRNMQEVTTVQEMGPFESRRSSDHDYFHPHKEAPPRLAFNT
jgi:hypothetical protein